jgi:hypothetical protein
VISGNRKAPWDQRLAEHMARQSWEAANTPRDNRRTPPLRERIRSIYFWVALGALTAGFVLFTVVGHGWPLALAAGLYMTGWLVMARGDRRLLSRR